MTVGILKPTCIMVRFKQVVLQSLHCIGVLCSCCTVLAFILCVSMTFHVQDMMALKLRSFSFSSKGMCLIASANVSRCAQGIRGTADCLCSVKSRSGIKKLHPEVLTPCVTVSLCPQSSARLHLGSSYIHTYTYVSLILKRNLSRPNTVVLANNCGSCRLQASMVMQRLLQLQGP